MKWTSLVLVAVFTVLAVLVSLMHRLVVPYEIITLLPIIVVLAAALLGPNMSTISVTLYVLIGLFGLPVFERPPYGGFLYILQPTFGFYIGSILAAYIVGRLIPRKAAANYLHYFGASVVGIFVIYMIGLSYASIIAGKYTSFSSRDILTSSDIPMNVTYYAFGAVIISFVAMVISKIRHNKTMR